MATKDTRDIENKTASDEIYHTLEALTFYLLRVGHGYFFFVYDDEVDDIDILHLVFRLFDGCFHCGTRGLFLLFARAVLSSLFFVAGKNFVKKVYFFDGFSYCWGNILRKETRCKVIRFNFQ